MTVGRAGQRPWVRRIGLVVLGVLVTWALAYAALRGRSEGPVPPLYTEVLEPAALESLEIAPLATALTLARYRSASGELHVLRVESYGRGEVRGVDISDALPRGADPIAALEHRGHDGLVALAGTPRTVRTADLELPFDGADVQIAVGINYPEHGTEVQVEQSFLFPKAVAPSHARSEINGRWELLDYEVELGFVALGAIAAGRPLPAIGLVLASDYTDRAALLRHLDLGDVSSGRGFSLAKGEPAFMPVGDLLVIPRDLEAFVRDLRLHLYLNGRLRQLAEPARLTWPLGRILDQTFARASMRWRSGSRELALPVPDGVIPARTIILSGTPDGVLFRGLGLRHRFLGGTELVAGVHGWRLQAVVEPYIRESIRDRAYLQPGDRVVMRADRLGMITNTIGRPSGPLAAGSDGQRGP